MFKMELDLTSLEKAVYRLSEAVNYSHSDMAKKDEPLFQQFRNSVIQCFEFTYELCWKMLKRRLELDSPSPAIVDEFNFNDLVREGAIRGIVQDPARWINYRKFRNLTSHAYNEKMAQEVYEIALSFLDDARQLLNSLKEKNR